MGPFWLVAVRGQNFRSFAELEVHFQRNGLTLARGHNLDTGGSSYSGKSTIGLAVAWALGYLPFSAKDQRRWGGEGSTWVELDIGTDAGVGTIRAGDKPFFRLPDGRKTTSASAIKEEIQRFLGTNPEILAALTWQRQKKGSRFLSKTDSEKKEFLSNVMPFLIKLEQSAEATDLEIKRIQANLDSGKRLVEQAEINLRSLVVAEPVLVKITNAGLEDLQNKGSQLLVQLAAIRESLGQINQKGVVVPGLQEKTAARVQITEQEAAVRAEEGPRIQAFNSEARRLNGLVNDATNQVALIGRLQKEIVALQANQCPTCEQKWNRSPQHLAECIAKLRVAIEARQILPTLIEKLNCHKFESDPRIAQLELIRREADGELGRLQEQQRELVDSKNAAKATVDRELTEINRLIYQNNLEIAEIKHAEELAKKENGHRVADYVAAIQRREAVAAKLDLYRADVLKDTQALHAEEDFQSLIGRKGFLGSIFEEVLHEISEEANTILRTVANTAHVSIQFLSEVSTVKGKINKVITPAITIGGNRADLESGASGGMETSIGLAVDLAVATVISRRTNTWPGWLILDESFEGLDQISKETCMTMLAIHARDRLVLVVDHAAETRELFSSFIDIEFQDGVSKILS